MKTSNILQIASYGGPYSGGFISSLLHLEEKIAEQTGLGTVYVFSSIAEGRPWLQLFHDRGSPVLFIDKQMAIPKRYRTVTAIAREYNAALVHSHFGAFDLDAAVAGARVGAKVVWHVHSDLEQVYKVRQRMKDLIKMRLIARTSVDAIITVSSGIAQTTKLRGAPVNKIIGVRNGIDTNRFQRVNRSLRATSRQRCNITDEQLVFLLFGWDPRIKGVDLLCQAMSAINQRNNLPALCIIVSGDKNQDVISEMIGKLPWIRVIHPVENVAELYAIADCFVSASRTEAFSFAIGEAMASGLPVVSSNLAHLVSIFGPAGEGFLTFRNGHAEDLAMALGRILDMPSDHRRRLGEANRRFIDANLTINHWTEKMMHLYRSILNE
ncbi:MAG TPA: glycosyltransferase family 4 protein [Bellilinea sp.]|nr:glycosyltransferase family 4 protein [Bellilinea sp.]